MDEPGAIRIAPRIAIPLREIEMTFARAGGPGGQNVNKVASKAVARFNLRDSPSIPDGARARALQRLASRLTRDGALVLASATHRDQARNRAAVLERLRRMLAAAVTAPTRRVPTVPGAAVRARRLDEKKRRARRKRDRRPPAAEDE